MRLFHSHSNAFVQRQKTNRADPAAGPKILYRNVLGADRLLLSTGLDLDLPGLAGTGNRCSSVKGSRVMSRYCLPGVRPYRGRNFLNTPEEVPDQKDAADLSGACLLRAILLRATGRETVLRTRENVGRIQTVKAMPTSSSKEKAGLLACPFSHPALCSR